MPPYKILIGEKFQVRDFRIETLAFKLPPTFVNQQVQVDGQSIERLATILDNDSLDLPCEYLQRAEFGICIHFLEQEFAAQFRALFGGLLPITPIGSEFTVRQ